MMKQEKVKKVKIHFHFNKDPQSRNVAYSEKCFELGLLSRNPKPILFPSVDWFSFHLC